MTDADNLPRHRSSRPPLPDALGKLCTEGKATAQYLWQVPDDADARAKIVALLNQIAVEAQKQNRKEMGRDVTELLPAGKARTLAMDAVQQADSGHHGTAMALAPLAWVLWQRHLRFDPAHPDWPDRDRFVLSCGHACMLLYAVLYLTGYDLTLDEIKQFRQWGSRTPGHSEFGLTRGVEATTGPLGQGVGNAVVMAIAEEQLAALFTRPGHAIVDHRTYFVCTDGDLMEGISHEACSLARHLRLGQLIRN